MSENKGWRNWGDHPVVVLIIIVAALIGIITSIPNLRAMFFNSISPSRTEESTSPSPSLTSQTLPNESPTSEGTILPIPTGKLLFSDNFESGKAEGWVNVNDGEWSLWQDNGNWVYGVHDQPADIIQTVFLDGSQDWQNYSFETEVMFKSGRFEQIWLTARTGKDNQCAGYIFGGNRFGIQLFRYDQKSTCTRKTLAEASNYRLYENRLYKIRLDVVGNQIRGYIDDELILSGEDSIYPRGGIALSAYEVAWASFDNIRVYSLER